MSDFKAQFKAAKAVRGSGSSAKLVSPRLSLQDMNSSTFRACTAATYTLTCQVVCCHVDKGADPGVEGPASSCRG